MNVVLVACQSSRPIAQRGKLALLDPPVSLLTLAASIRDIATPRILDSQLAHLTPEETARAILDLEPDIVGFNLNFVSLLRATDRAAQIVRAEAPDVPIVVGGNYATFFKDELIQRDWIDAVFMHEADLSFPELVRRYQATGRLSPVSGTLMKVNGDLHETRFTAYVENLDTLPFAAYDLLPDRKQYLTSLVTSRGCPYDCIYCSTKAMWGGWRCRSAANLFEEIDALIPTLPLPRINIFDDIFTVNKKRVYEFCEGMRSRGLPLSWGMSARAETVDDEMLATLGESGCRNIFFGFESGSERILKKLNRHYTPADIERVVDQCIAAGIIPHASFMIGMPWETREDVEKTFAILERLNTPFILYNLFTPFVGTPVFKDPGSYGVTLFDDAAGEDGQIDTGMAFHRTEGLSAEEIKELWIEGTGIVVSRGRERDAYEAVHWEHV